MHYLQPLAEFLASSWKVWLICMLILFAVRVRLVPKPEDSKESQKDGRFLRYSVSFVMVSFCVLFVLSLAALIGQQYGIW